MADLAAFQRAFATAIGREGRRHAFARQPGFAVYRNTTPAALVDMLAGHYPVTAAILGEELFAAAAFDFARTHPPADPVLIAWGGGFDVWLQDQSWITDLAYLPAIAAIERMRGEALDAADAPALGWDHLAGLDAEAWAEQRLPLHPACRFNWFTAPAVTIWRAHDEGFETLAPEWRAEGVLVTRPDAIVQLAPLDAAGHRLLFGLMLRESAGEAAAATRKLYPAADLAATFATLVNAGALAVPPSLERI